MENKAFMIKYVRNMLCRGTAELAHIDINHIDKGLNHGNLNLGRMPCDLSGIGRVGDLYGATYYKVISHLLAWSSLRGSQERFLPHS